MAVKLIAELCQNHLGDAALVREMVDRAADAGATHIKIQHIHTKNLVYRSQFEHGLIVDGTTKAICRPWQPEYDRLRPLELGDDVVKQFVDHVRSRGVVPLTTCFARCDIPLIKAQGFEVIKVASYDCASFPMLRELADAFPEVLVSTGATFADEITQAADLLRARAARFSLLHCVTLYPTPLGEIHLARLEWLRSLCGSVGFSDHSHVARDGVIASKAALALGADVIERHFTILEADKSKDGPVSITPDHLRELARFATLSLSDRVRELDLAMPEWRTELLGSDTRDLSNAELLNRDYYRGRFASPRFEGRHDAATMIFNWEETHMPVSVGRRSGKP